MAGSIHASIAQDGAVIGNTNLYPLIVAVVIRHSRQNNVGAAGAFAEEIQLGCRASPGIGKSKSLACSAGIVPNLDVGERVKTGVGRKLQ